MNTWYIKIYRYIYLTIRYYTTYKNIRLAKKFCDCKIAQITKLRPSHFKSNNTNSLAPLGLGTQR